MNYKTRTKWTNDARNQEVYPLRIYEPSTIDDLVSLIKLAEAEGVSVRAVGSGHSWSDVCLTPDYLLQPSGLTRVLKLDKTLTAAGVDSSTLIEVESGIRLSELNDTLDKLGLALPNMGGFDGQTIAGVTATSTHGSGIKYGPLPEIIESFEVVAAQGQIYRVERTAGITDPQAYKKKYLNRILVQNDDWYYAMGVAIGCLGVIYSVILRVTKAFWLEEKRVLSTWNQVKADLERGDVLTQNEHYELLLNPYEINGVRRCIVTTRNSIPKPTNLSPITSSRNILNEMLSSVPYIGDGLRLWMDLNPDSVPNMLNGVLKSMVEDSYINKSYNVFNIGAANNVASYSAELGFPVSGTVYLDGIDHIFNIAAEAKANGHIVHSGPIAVRFVRGTKFHLSPQYGENLNTAMVELIFVKDTVGCLELMYKYETESYQFGGRPHWGQVNSMTGSKAMLAKLYPKLGTWLEVREQLNPDGTFDSPFSKRVGLGEGPTMP